MIKKVKNLYCKTSDVTPQWSGETFIEFQQMKSKLTTVKYAEEGKRGRPQKLLSVADVLKFGGKVTEKMRNNFVKLNQLERGSLDLLSLSKKKEKQMRNSYVTVSDAVYDISGQEFYKAVRNQLIHVSKSGKEKHVNAFKLLSVFPNLAKKYA